VTLYTANFFSPAFGGSPAFMQQQQEEAPPALGMGSRHLDTCVRSAFQNQDLSGRCHQSVGEFLLAVDHGSPASPYHREFGAAANPVEEEGTILLWLLSSHNSEHVEVFSQQVEPKKCGVFGMAMVLTGLLCAVFLFETCFGTEEEKDDEEAEEDVGGSDYAALPEVSEGERSLKPHVFVGVPVQVV